MDAGAALIVGNHLSATLDFAREHAKRLSPGFIAAVKGSWKRFNALMDTYGVDYSKDPKGVKKIPKDKQWLLVLLQAESDIYRAHIKAVTGDKKITPATDVEKYVTTESSPSLFMYSVVSGACGALVGMSMGLRERIVRYGERRTATQDARQIHMANRNALGNSKAARSIPQLYE